MGNTILNIAAGKFKPIDLPITFNDGYFLINLDTMYYDYTPVNIIENDIYKYIDENVIWTTMNERFCNVDAFQFLERTKTLFNRICIYRFLEHISFNNIYYFIYLLSTATEKGSIIDVIVPDYKKLSKMILAEDINSKDFEKNNILITTEFLNEQSDPHASIWTFDRIHYYFELEGRFKINEIQTNYEFDGRDIYLRFLAERI